MIDTGKKVEFRGVPIEFGNTVLIVPPITCDQADELIDSIEAATNVPEGEREKTKTEDGYRDWYRKVRARRKEMRKVISAAVRRNYPEISDPEINCFVTEENVHRCFNAATGNAIEAKIKDPGEYKPAENAAGLT